jgi:hypothetical protein
MLSISDSDKTESASVNIGDLAGGITIAPNDWQVTPFQQRKRQLTGCPKS